MNESEMFVKAKLARSFLTRGNRAESGEVYIYAKDGAPEWMQTLCQDAHDEILPDDYVYSVIEDALDSIIDNDGDADSATDSIEADTYNRDLLAWLASHTFRVGYCDEAAEEIGLGSDAGIIDRIQLGQCFEKRAIFQSVINSLENIEIEEIDGLE